MIIYTPWVENHPSLASKCRDVTQAAFSVLAHFSPCAFMEAKHFKHWERQGFLSDVLSWWQTNIQYCCAAVVWLDKNVQCLDAALTWLLKFSLLLTTWQLLTIAGPALNVFGQLILWKGFTAPLAFPKAVLLITLSQQMLRQACYFYHLQHNRGTQDLYWVNKNSIKTKLPLWFLEAKDLFSKEMEKRNGVQLIHFVQLLFSKNATPNHSVLSIPLL